MSARYGSASGRRGAEAAEGDVCSTRVSAAADPLDLVYAARLQGLVAAYPDDPDIASLHAEAQMIATRDDWWDRTTGAPAGQIGAVAQHLERLLASTPAHTGLNHYLIHALDASPSVTGPPSRQSPALHTRSSTDPSLRPQPPARCTWMRRAT